MDSFLTNFISEKIQEAAAIALLAANDAQIKIKELTAINKPVAIKHKTTRLSKPPTIKPPTNKPLVTIIMTYLILMPWVKKNFFYILCFFPILIICFMKSVSTYFEFFNDIKNVLLSNFKKLSNQSEK